MVPPTYTHTQVDISNANGKWTLTEQHITFDAVHKYKIFKKILLREIQKNKLVEFEIVI